MPLTFYEDTTQISKLVKKPYKFKLPTFGESRTDPTFYEPTATRIANMRKSASSGVALYDYEGDFKRSDVEKQTREHVFEPARNIGITREELSQIVNTTAKSIDKKIDSAKEEQKDKIAEKQRIQEMAKSISETVNGSSDNE